MLAVGYRAAMADVEVARLALDAARVQASTTAHAVPARDLGQHGVARGSQALRGNGRGLRHLALDHAHGVGEAQAIRIELAQPDAMTPCKRLFEGV